MFPKISVEKTVFLQCPDVFLEVEAMSTIAHVESRKVLLIPKLGYLIPLLVVLSKSSIPYTITYHGRDDAEALSSVIQDQEINQ